VDKTAVVNIKDTFIDIARIKTFLIIMSHPNFQALKPPVMMKLFFVQPPVVEQLLLFSPSVLHNLLKLDIFYIDKFRLSIISSGMRWVASVVSPGF